MLWNCFRTAKFIGVLVVHVFFFHLKILNKFHNGQYYTNPSFLSTGVCLGFVFHFRTKGFEPNRAVFFAEFWLSWTQLKSIFFLLGGFVFGFWLVAASPTLLTPLNALLLIFPWGPALIFFCPKKRQNGRKWPFSRQAPSAQDLKAFHYQRKNLRTSPVVPESQTIFFEQWGQTSI